MNHKTYKQLELEPYFEHGQAKLRYKQANTSDTIPDIYPKPVAPAPKADD